MASQEPVRRSYKRKQPNNQASENNENLNPIDVIDLTVDTPIRLAKGRKTHQAADITIDLDESSATPQSNKKSEGTGIICPVCYDTLTNSMMPMSTKCGHIFCNNCLINSLKMRKKCPMCTTSITEKTCRRLYFHQK